MLFKVLLHIFVELFDKYILYIAGLLVRAVNVQRYMYNRNDVLYVVFMNFLI